MARDPKPTVAELEEEAANRGIDVVEGSGADGNVVKADLVEALQDAPVELAGRPPLIDVAREAAERDARNATDLSGSDQ